VITQTSLNKIVINDVFLPSKNPNPVTRLSKVSPIPKVYKQGLINVILKVKNTCKTPLEKKQLQRIIQDQLLQNQKPNVADVVRKSQRNLSSSSYEEINQVHTTLEKSNIKGASLQSSSYEEILEKSQVHTTSEKSKIAKAEVLLSTATMDPCMALDPSVFINFDQLLDDIIDTDLQSNNDAILDKVLQELSTDSSDSFTESILPTEEFSCEFDSQDLSELPLEDFTNLESFLDALDCNVPMKDNNIDQSQVLSVNQENSIDIEDIISDLSAQSSPSECQNYESKEFNEILDSVFDSDFVKEFLLHENVNTEVSDVAEIPNTNNVSNVDVLESNQDNFLIAGCKRKSSDVDDGFVNKKFSKKNDSIIPLKIKDNESEKEAIRRVKNNQASKVTRAKRKVRQGDLYKQQTELEKSNALLKVKIEVMQKEAEILRQVLVSKLSTCKT